MSTINIHEVVNNTIRVSANKDHEAHGHAQTLLGQRSAGSYWAERHIPHDFDDLEQMLHDTKPFLGEGDMFIPDCLYFKGEYTTAGTVGFITKAQLRSSEEVIVANGDHGLELRVRTKKALRRKAVRTKEFWFIVGPAGKEDNSLIIWTCYPGPLTARIPEDFYTGYWVGGDIVDPKFISKDWALKLI
jgi:hypothetical protein